jgi:dTDP-4-dehydrorhamnose reductase
MRILIIGGGGMLGHKLVQAWKSKFDVWVTLKSDFKNYEKYGFYEQTKTLTGIDAENFASVLEALEKAQPDIIFNAVGVIKQLPSSKDVVKTLTVNSIFPHRLSEAAAKFNARLINISTDCVFDGARGNYNEEDLSNATDLYGKSKNLGEVTGENCLTLRTSIIGRELNTAHSLVEWFLSHRGKKVKGYLNAIYTGFPTVVMAGIIGNLIEHHEDLSGLYHISSEPINKYDLLKLINEAYDADIEIEPFDDFRIDRSLDSTKIRKLTGFQPASWEEMIREMANDPTPYEKWRT